MKGSSQPLGKCITPSSSFWSEFLPALMKYIIFLPCLFSSKRVKINPKLFNVTCRGIDYPSKTFFDFSVQKRPPSRVLGIPRYAVLYFKYSIVLFFLLDKPKREILMYLVKEKTRSETVQIGRYIIPGRFDCL